MIDLEDFAEQTCHKTLNASQLKAICRWRKFQPPRGSKEVLASFVAPRLLETTGVGEAMASLEEPWLLVLHAIAMEGRPAEFGDLIRLIMPLVKASHPTDAVLFKALADGLLSRGVVVVDEVGGRGYYSTSRFGRFAFHVPEPHRAFLPPFPVPAAPLDEPLSRKDPLMFCRTILLAGAGKEGSEPDARGPGLLERLVSRLHMDEGGIRMGDGEIPDLGTLRQRVRAQWSGVRGSRRPGKQGNAVRTVAHVASHLPAGEGVDIDDLTRAVGRMGQRTTQEAVHRSCIEGYEAGLLVKSTSGETVRYAAIQEPGALPHDDPLVDDPLVDDPLVFDASDDAVHVDLARTGLNALLGLATISRVKAAGETLRLVPDIVRMGRALERLGSLGALGPVRSACAAYERAIKHVEGRKGKLLLHEGLAVLQVEDLNVRLVLERELGDKARSLGGGYLAIPAHVTDIAVKLVEEQGFFPRRIK